MEKPSPPLKVNSEGHKKVSLKSQGENSGRENDDPRNRYEALAESEKKKPRQNMSPKVEPIG